MQTEPSLPHSANRSGRRGARQHLVVSWLLASAIILCAGTLILAADGRLYLWWWTNHQPSLPKDFGPDGLAPDFTLLDLEGRPFHLSEEVHKSPVVLEVGSFS